MNVYRGGVPYAMDIKRLNDAFPLPSLTEGRIIEHEQLEETLGLHRANGNQRYYSVINAWRHQLLAANGVFLAWKATIGVEVLDPAGVLSHADGKTRQKLRQMGRAIRLYGWVDRSRLDPVGQQVFDHKRRVCALLEDSLRSARKDLPIPLGPFHSLPKPPKPEAET